MMGGLTSGSWDTLVGGRERELHARDSSSLRGGWWGSGGGTKDAGNDDDDDDDDDDERGDDGVVGGLVGSGACDTLVVEVCINEWGGCASGRKGG